jgi:hypothetical protein
MCSNESIVDDCIQLGRLLVVERSIRRDKTELLYKIVIHSQITKLTVG